MSQDTTELRLYVGTKIIRAVAQAKNYGPVEGHGQPGYKVVYPDGYTSWSPAQAFEEAYIVLPEGAEKLQPHQQRVVAEKAELDQRISKLVAFLGSDFYKTLPHDEALRLTTQYEAMHDYSEVLQARIAAF